MLLCKSLKKKTSQLRYSASMVKIIPCSRRIWFYVFKEITSRIKESWFALAGVRSIILKLGRQTRSYCQPIYHNQLRRREAVTERCHNFSRQLRRKKLFLTGRNPGLKGRPFPPPESLIARYSSQRDRSDSLFQLTSRFRRGSLSLTGDPFVFPSFPISGPRSGKSLTNRISSR